MCVSIPYIVDSLPPYISLNPGSAPAGGDAQRRGQACDRPRAMGPIDAGAGVAADRRRSKAAEVVGERRWGLGFLGVEILQLWMFCTNLKHRNIEKLRST